MEAKTSPIFKKLSFDSINRINNHINLNKSKELKNTNSQELKNEDKRYDTGNFLSDRIKKKFPTKLFGIPIEEIDENFKKEKVCRVLDLRILNFLLYLL
jgi:hypothetical protein